MTRPLIIKRVVVSQEWQGDRLESVLACRHRVLANARDEKVRTCWRCASLRRQLSLIPEPEGLR
mgnify:CR=1 FL=1